MDPIKEVLRKFQFENNLTQHDMANYLNISQPTYNNWINDKTIVDPKYYPKIAELCKIELSSLIPANASVNIIARNLPENGLKVNALELYEKFTHNLQEHNQLLKNEIERYKGIIQSKDEVIKNQSETINSLKKT